MNVLNAIPSKNFKPCFDYILVDESQDFPEVFFDVCKKVVTVEENKESCDKAREVIQTNRIKNVEIHNMDAAKFFAKEKRKFDAIILDRPRKGCTKESLDEAIRLTNNTIIYVSCNPATLARDLKYLTEHGFVVESVQPFDMFCHTYHVDPQNPDKGCRFGTPATIHTLCPA